MIKGRYGDTSKRPYIEGRMSLTAQKLNTDISFVFDTGADRTVLMPMDGAKLRLDYSQLTWSGQSTGVGGTSRSCQAQGIVSFRDEDGSLYNYKIPILIIEPTPAIASVPSLLGRDIINCWKIDYDPMVDALEAEVQRADMVLGNASPRFKDGVRVK